MKKLWKKIAFEIKLWWIDWKFYTFNPFSTGIFCPPSHYLRHTQEEQQKELEDLRKILKKYEEQNDI